ncbi:hypothetical protein ABFS83_08G142100 [Erythranthe nasuta]
MENTRHNFSSKLLLHLQRSKRSFYAFIYLLSLCLLAYNSAAIFCTQVPVSPERRTPTPSPENVAGKSRKFFSVHSQAKLSSSVLYSVAEENPTPKMNTHLPLLHKNRILAPMIPKLFEERVSEFFAGGGSFSCKFRFFMTWISSVESFGEREFFAVSSLFKSHPNGCLIIASSSLDSVNGSEILKPFSDKGFKIAAITPDFNYLFNNTPAQSWYNRLMQGNVNPGVVPLGQNLSNLLRLGLLYRFGGIYLDTDVIILRNFGELKNAIGAQTLDHETGNWSRLNNAVMVFDKGHPLVYKFIEEFALTFNGRKWGHNGPYLVSRVVSRVSGRVGYDFTILPPIAFYPVDWSRIGSLFKGPRGDLIHSKWLVAKLRQIRSESFAVHLWNKQSRKMEVEKGSVIHHILMSI